jgi:hypothetical protein
VPHVTPDDDIRPYLDKAKAMAENGDSKEQIQNLLLPGLRGLISRHVDATRIKCGFIYPDCKERL